MHAALQSMNTHQLSQCCCGFAMSGALYVAAAPMILTGAFTVRVVAYALSILGWMLANARSRTHMSTTLLAPACSASHLPFVNCI